MLHSAARCQLLCKPDCCTESAGWRLSGTWRVCAPFAEMRQTAPCESEHFSHSPSAKTSLTQGAVIHLTAPTSEKFTGGAGAERSNLALVKGLSAARASRPCSREHNAFELWVESQRGIMPLLLLGARPSVELRACCLSVLSPGIDR